MSEYTYSERWRAVPGWEGKYEVSDHGNVRSVERTVIRRDGKPYPVKGRVFSIRLGSAGYPQVLLRDKEKKRQAHNHVLVLEAFVGPRPKGHQACHWDDDKTNNHLSNLRWGTPSENAKDSIRNGTNRYSGRTHCNHGHELTPENTYLQGNSRTCKTCRRATDRKRYKKEKK